MAHGFSFVAASVAVTGAILGGLVVLCGVPRAAAQQAGVARVEALPEVTNVDHAGMIRAWDDKTLERGRKIYTTVCFACHGVDGKRVTVEKARAFAVDPLARGCDPYSMFKVVTFGFSTMPQQQWLTPEQRYDVIDYIRETFLKTTNSTQYTKVDDAYLKGLPKPSADTHSDKHENKETDFGPVLCSNLNRAFPAVLTHRLPGGVSVSYDLHRMQLAGVWTGGYLDLAATRFHQQRGEAPVKPAGALVNGLQTWKWAYDGRFDYGQLPPRGPAPEKFMRYFGHSVHGDQAVMSYSIAGTRILEMPTVEQPAGLQVFQHTLQIEPGGKPLELCVAELDQAAAARILTAGTLDLAGQLDAPAAGTLAVLTAGKPTPFHVACAVIGDSAELSWRIEDGRRLVLHLAPAARRRTIQVLRNSATGDEACGAFSRHVKEATSRGTLPDLAVLTQAGPNRFPQPLTVEGKLGEPVNGYALDTVPLPVKNPYNAWLRTSALAFFPDGRCAVCTYTGDVWIVSGIDQGLSHVTWQRFASGLYEPFGLQVIDGLIYVTCRDGIKRLHDFNGDGYADYYETFFADPDVSAFFHAFCFDLQRDSKGCLYYAKAGQYTDFKEPGAVVKVAPDGRSFEYLATGFRTPNGMGMLPGDRVLCSDNEGNWMPASKINLCHKGGFYGYVQTDASGAWAPDGGKIDHRKVVPPATFDQPMLWLPVSEDNSSGAQLWVDDRRFGPLAGRDGRILHSSFGKGWIYYLMPQEIAGVTQAACVTLPQQWDAGVQRIRTNPHDGQLYGVGISGWQGPRGGQDGCLQRLRYTGAPCRLIDNVQVTAKGVEICFNFDLDLDTARNPANYELEMWNYLWRPEYGSPFFSVRNPGTKGTDKISGATARVADDKRRVVLEWPDIVACQQLRVRMNLKGADGQPFTQKFYQTINRLPEK